MSHPPHISRVSAELGTAGSDVTLRIESSDGSADYVLAQADIGGVVTLLLALSGYPSQTGQGLLSRGHLPVDSVSLGRTGIGDALLDLEIGAVHLTFALPSQHLRRLGEALLTASAGAERPI